MGARRAHPRREVTLTPTLTLTLALALTLIPTLSPNPDSDPKPLPLPLTRLLADFEERHARIAEDNQQVTNPIS